MPNRSDIPFIAAVFVAAAGVLTVKFTGTEWSSLSSALAVAVAIGLKSAMGGYDG